MADDKVQIELEPIISPASVARIKQQMSGGMQGGGLAGGMPSGMGGMGAMVGLAAAGGAAIGAAALSTVGTANPATMEMFNQALEDITGVIGRSLIPVVELMTEGARMFGDFLASIIPDTAALFEPLHEVMEALKEAIDPLIPLIRDFLAGSLEVLADVVRKVADSMVWLLNKLGVSGGGNNTNNWSSSVGAASKGSNYESVGDLNKGTIAGAYGMGGGANPAERTAKSTEKLAADVAKILEKMNGPGGDFGGFPNE